MLDVLSLTAIQTASNSSLKDGANHGGYTLQRGYGTAWTTGEKNDAEVEHF
jgi:hypothetical protein